MTRLIFAAWGGLRMEKSQVKHFYDRAAAVPVASILATRAEPKEIEKCIAYAAKVPKQVDLWLDSGAYSSWTKGVEFTAATYLEWINSFRSQLKAFRRVFVVSLDKIPGRYGVPPTAADYRDAVEITLENTRWLLSQGLQVVPVHHQGEPIELFREYLSLCEYVGISPANDSPQTKRLAYCRSLWQTLKEHSSDAVFPTHNFGNIAIEQLKVFPFYSADSTSWKVSTGFGGAAEKALAGKVGSRQSKVISYQAKHSPSAAYFAAVQEQLKLERELQKLWALRGMTFTEPQGIEL